MRQLLPPWVAAAGAVAGGLGVAHKPQSAGRGAGCRRKSLRRSIQWQPERGLEPEGSLEPVRILWKKHQPKGSHHR